MTNINALPANQFYYCFSGVSIDVCGARYNKDVAYSNVNSIYSTLNSIPSYLAAYFLPSFTTSDAMSVYARQKIDAMGPCGRESCEFDTVMTYDQRKAAAGVPSANNVTEVIIYPQYGNPSSYKGAIRYVAVDSSSLMSMVKPGTFKMGASCGCHASRGSICVIAVTENYAETSQTLPTALTEQSTPALCLASCTMSAFMPLAADIDDRNRPTIVNQASTEEATSYDIYQKLNLFKTRAGDFYQTYGSSTSSAISLAYNSDENPIQYSRALGDALREKLFEDTCGTSINLDLTTRFNSITIVSTIDISYTTDFLAAAVQNSDFVTNLQACDFRFIGVACALTSSSTTLCKVSFASNLWIKSSYSVQTPVWTSSTISDWSSSFCSNIYCKLGTAVTGCEDTVPTSAQCTAAIPSCTACQYDSSNVLSICTTCSQGTTIKSNNKCTICSNLNSSTGQCSSCSDGILYNNACVESCPSGYQIDSGSNTCISSCPSYCAQCSLISGINYCIQCSSSTCVLECPSTIPISHYTSLTTSECVAQCSTYGVLIPINPSPSIIVGVTFPLCLDCPSQYCTSCTVSSTLMPDITKLTICNSCGPNGGTNQYVKDNTCVTSCGTTYYQSGGSCVACPSGTQIYSNPSLCENCGDKCTSGYCTTQNGNPYCTQCMSNSYIQENKCLSACAGAYTLFSQTSQSLIYQCLQTCTSALPYQTSSNECVASCPITTYIDTSTSKCIDCPAGMQVYSDPTVCENCGDQCVTGYCTSQNNRPLCTNCTDNSFLQDGKCITACSSDYTLRAQTSQTTVTECLKACTSTYPYLTTSNECVSTCPLTFYLDTSTSSCIACPAGMQVYSNPSLCENCGDQCENGYCTTQNGNPYCTQCMSNSYIQEGKCLSTCTGDYKLFSQTSTTGVYQCLKTCTSTYSLQISSGECVSACPVTSYVDTSTSTCIACPAGMQVYSDPTVCENCGDQCVTGYCTSQNNRPLCTNCTDNSFLQDGKCITACSSDYTLRAQTSQTTVTECLKACTSTYPYLTTSNECVSTCPLTFYLDTSTSSCIACPAGMQVYSNPSLCENCGDQCENGYCTTQNGNPYCTQCMSNSYIQEGKCLSTCTGDYKLFSQTSTTGVYQCLKTCTSTYSLQISSGECVSACPVTSYVDTSTSTCIACPAGMQVYSDPTVCENCGDQCVTGYCTSQNNRPLCTNCTDNSFLQDGKCITACSSDYTLRAQTSQTTVTECLKACTSTYPYLTTSNECVSTCPLTFYLDTSTSSCIACPAGMQVYSNPSLCENCGDQCENGYCTTQNGNPYCTQCMSNSYIQEGKCLSTCTGDYKLFSQTSTTGVYQCLKTCTSTYSLQISSGECVSACPVTSYVDTSTSTCIACPAGMQVYSDPTVCENCGDQCVTGYCTSQNNRPLCTNCTDNYFLQDGKCITACSSDYTLRAQTSQTTVTECLKACTSTYPYLTTSNECVSTCPLTFYLDTSTSSCIACPAGMQVYSNPSLCENCGDQCENGYCTTQNGNPYCTQCMSNSYIQEGKCLSTCTGDYKLFSQTSTTGVYQCLKTCTSTYSLQISSGECVSACPVTSYVDTSTSTCIACPAGMQVYSDPTVCENCGDQCVTGYCTSQNNRPLCTNCTDNSFLQDGKCITACSSDYTLRAQTSQTTVTECLKACTSTYPYLTSNNECVALCPITAYIDTTTSQCVDCPTGTHIYSNPYLCENCGDKCTDGACTSQNNLPVCTSCMSNSYKQEGKCLSACSGNYVLFSQTTDAGIYQCLTACTSAFPYQTSNNECVATCPNTAYLDTVNLKCVDCPTGMQVYSNPSLCENCGSQCADGYCTTQNGNPYCTQCMSNSYIQEGKCLSACTGDYILYSQTTNAGIYQCLTACPTDLTYQTSSGECVASCPNTAYLDTTNSKCVDCPAGMQVYSNPSLCENCGDKCENGYCTTQNSNPYCTQCMSNSYIQENKCLSSCTVDYPLYSQSTQNEVMQCLKTCTTNFPYQTSSGECVASCPNTAYLDTVNSKCIDCPAGMQVYSKPSLCENCGDMCTSGYCTSQNNLPVCTKCMDNSYIQEGKCLVACTGDYVLYSLTSTNLVYQCMKKCTLSLPYQTSSNQCVATCPLTSYLDTSTSSCIDCPTGMQVYSNPSLCENCGDMCTSGYCTSQNNLPVCTKCMDNSYIQGSKCLSACTGNYKLFIKTSQNTIYQCLTACPSTAQYHLQTNECVQACPSTSYIDVSSMQCVDCTSQFAGCNFCAAVTDPSSLTTSVKCKQCSSATPYFSSDLSTCVSSCSTGETLVQTSSYGYCLKCPSACTSCSVSDDKIKCSSCASGYNYDESSGSCSTKCPLLKYVYNNQCVSSCPSGYSAQLDTGNCVACSIDGCAQCISIGSYFSCQQCAAGRIKSGNLLTGYKCDTVCDISNAIYCTNNGACTQVTGYKDASGNCQDCPDNCSKCSLDTSGNVQCTQCNDKYCINNSTNTCQLAASSSYVLMYYIDSVTNSESIQCKSACDAGYIADIYNSCIMCDTSKYSQCSDANCASWIVIDNVPYCKSCNDGYQTDLLNKNICKIINSCLIGQVSQSNNCVFCKDIISNCAECFIDSGTPKCSKCNIGYTVNAQNGCSLSTCVNSIMSSDGSSCVNQCSTSQYYLPTQNKCLDCAISNCKNCFYYNGNQLCVECGKDSLSTNNDLSIDLQSCLVSCPTPQIADSKGRCVSPPNNAATFIIAKELDWSIIDQLKKGLDVICPHILSATSCNSGYNLLKKYDNTQYCDVCALNTVYDSTSKSCVSCGDNCKECLSQTACKTCVPNTYLVSGNCYWNCPREMYVESGACTQCDNACGGLNGSCFAAGPNSCDGCQFDTSTNKFVTFLIQNANQCVSAANCPLSTFPADNGKCMPCDSGCTSCTGLGTQNCLDIKITSVDSTLCSLDYCSTCSDLFHCSQCESTYQLNSDGTCTKVCDQGYYSDDNINCKQCDSTCFTCVKAGECTQCKESTSTSGYYSVALVNGECQYQQCPSNCRFCRLDDPAGSPVCYTCLLEYKLNSSLNACISDPTAVAPTSCSPGQRFVDSCCIPCQNPFTTRCYTGSTASGVIEVSVACQKGYYLADGICLPICKDGYFADQILGWCVKCACSCNTCTNYMDKCDNKCSVGTFSTVNDRCEYPLSSSPIIIVDAPSNTINVKFPTNTAILNMIDTDISSESIYNTDNVCGDEAFNSDWSDFFMSSLNIDFMVSDLKSKLNSNEQNELDYLIAQDYSSISNSLISNNLLINYDMQYEGQFEIIKLLALYRWSMLGKTDIVVPFTYSTDNFYSDSSLIDDTCSLLFDANSILELDNPDCSFVINSDSTLLVTVIAEDISKVDPNASINFNDVIYYVTSLTKLPVPSVSINMPTPNVQKGMTVVINMKDSITTCEDLVIDYQNSQGLGYNTTIAIKLDSIKDTATGNLITTNITLIQSTVNDAIAQLINKSVEIKSRVIVISNSYFKSLAGKTIYFSITFNNFVTGECKIIPKMVSIVGTTMLQIQSQLLIKRLITTSINNVRYVSCDSTSASSSNSQLACKGYIYQQDALTDSFTTVQVIFDKCIIDPTKINVDNIARIWVEATINGSLNTVEVQFAIEKIQCTCDLSQIKSSYGTADYLVVNSIICPTTYALKWTLKDNSGSSADITFSTNSPSFKILNYLTVGKTYLMNINIANTDMNVVYGTCSHLIDVQSSATTLNTQIRSSNSGSLQGALDFSIVTFNDTNIQIYVDSVALTLTESGSITDLLSTTFKSSYKLVDNTKLTFNPGIWKSGTTYVLTAVASLSGVTGKAIKLINPLDSTLFTADFSPKIVSTGDTIKVTITNKSPSQCLFCAVGFFGNNLFGTYEIFSEPEQLCGEDEYRTTSLVVPLFSNVDANNTDLAVLCIGDDTDLTVQQRTSLQRFKIMINTKTLASADIVPYSDPITAEDFDRLCLSILALPDTQCPTSYFNSICNQAISNKQDLIDQYTDQPQQLWKDLTNKLVYSLSKVVTCGDASLDSSMHQTVSVILNGICQTFAADDSVCTSTYSNLNDISCYSFDSNFINLMLKIVNNIEAKIVLDTNFSDLLNLLDVVQTLIECASTNVISAGSGTEIHSTESSIAILKVQKIDTNFKASIKQSSATRMNRRYLSSTSNQCALSFDKIASNLSNKQNLIVKVQLSNTCSQYTAKTCTGLVALTSSPPCCEYVIQSSLTSFNGSTSVQTIEVTSDQNGIAALSVPMTTCSSSTICAYYDKANSCWSTSGVTTQSDCSGCKSTHFSIFSLITPTSSPSNPSNSSNPVIAGVSDSLMMIYQNILLYICILMNLYLFFLFIKTCRNRNKKIHVASKRIEQINVKGYTKTLPNPLNEDMDEKMNNIRRMFEMNGANPAAMNASRVEEAKAMAPPNIERDDNEAEQSIDGVGQDNVIEAQTLKLEQSFCKSYFSTFCRKHRIVSSIVFTHPTLSNFSRGINVAFCIAQACFIIAIGLLCMDSEVIAVITIIAGLVLSRVLCVLLENLQHKKHQKYINVMQIVLVVILIIIEGATIFIPSQIKLSGSTLFNLSIIIYLIFEFVIYELISHIFQVRISRRLVKDPSRLSKMSKFSKLFLNPLVYESINQSA